MTFCCKIVNIVMFVAGNFAVVLHTCAVIVLVVPAAAAVLVFFTVVG